MSTYRVAGYVGAAPAAGEKRLYGFQFQHEGLNKSVWIPCTVISMEPGVAGTTSLMASVGALAYDTYTIKIDQSQNLEKYKATYAGVAFPSAGNVITGVKAQFLREHKAQFLREHETAAQPDITPGLPSITPGLPSIATPPKTDADSQTRLIIGGVIGGILLASIIGFGYASGRKAR